MVCHFDRLNRPRVRDIGWYDRGEFLFSNEYELSDVVLVSVSRLQHRGVGTCRTLGCRATPTRSLRMTLSVVGLCKLHGQSIIKLCVACWQLIVSPGSGECDSCGRTAVDTSLTLLQRTAAVYDCKAIPCRSDYVRDRFLRSHDAISHCFHFSQTIILEWLVAEKIFTDFV